MYATKLMEDGKWWVGWRYLSADYFDPIAAVGSMDDAMRAANRMNQYHLEQIDDVRRERIWEDR